MPIITCPKCQGKLRFPDGTPARRVKCPTCGNVFQSSEGTVPTAVPPAVLTPTVGPPPKPRDDGSDARDDRPRTRDDDDRDRRRREDYKDDDKDRRRRQRDDRDRRDDDDDDDGRRSRRRDDDESDRRRRDDEDDDRDRRSRRRDDDDDRRSRGRDDDDYERRRRRGPDLLTREGQYNRASLACLLCFIGGWLQVGAAGLMVFTIFLHWVGVDEGLQVFLVLAGLLGMGYWMTSAVGLGFLVSGPRDRGALGFSIATAAVAGLHVLLVIVIGTSREYGQFGGPNVSIRAADVHWDAFVSQMRALPVLLFAEIGMGDIWRNIAKGSLLPIFANMAEIARIVLLFLTLRAIMFCVRDRDGARLSMHAVWGNAIGAGGLLVIGILFGMLLLAVRPDVMTGKSESVSAVLHLFYLVLYLVIAGLAVGSTLIIRSIKARLDYRP